MAYKLSIVEVLLGKRATRLHINIDGNEFERSAILVAVCNGRYYGGGFLAAPESQLDDGVLDVMVVNEISLAKIAKVLPIYQAGKHFANGEIVPELENIVEYYPAKSVHIRPVDENQEVIVNVDGECGPDKELSAEIVPLSARLILPKKVYDKQM